MTTEYSHTQKGIIRPILLVCAAVCAIIGLTFVRDQDPLFVILFLSAALFAIGGWLFGTLTVSDSGDHLSVAFGPIPVFKTRIPYSEITGAEHSQSTFLAGWGIHYTRKGWLWNIGGYDCVVIQLKQKSILIGTDDAEGLIRFLNAKQSRINKTGDADIESK